jgi:hypothetical protein
VTERPKKRPEKKEEPKEGKGSPPKPERRGGEEEALPRMTKRIAPSYGRESQAMTAQQLKRDKKKDKSCPCSLVSS